MNQNRNSVFYLIAIGASLVVFVLATIGLFLPLVTINGSEPISIYSTVLEIIEFFKNIKDATFEKANLIIGLVRSTIVMSMAIMLLVKIILCFIKYCIKNLRNIVHPNDYYGEDMIKVCVQIAVFSMMLYAYFPSWEYDIGLELMTYAGIIGISIVSLLRMIEGLKSDHPWQGFFHSIVMFLAAIFLYTVVLVGMHSPVKPIEVGGRIAIIDEFTSYFTHTFMDFSSVNIVALLIEIAALFLLFSAFANVNASFMYVLGCVKKSKCNAKLHVQKEYHFRAIIRALLALAFFSGSIVFIIIKSGEAFGVEYTVGRTGIVSVILIAVSIILIIIAKRIKPQVNTYEKAEEKELKEEVSYLGSEVVSNE